MTTKMGLSDVLYDWDLTVWQDYELLLLGVSMASMVRAIHGKGGPTPKFCVGRKRDRVWMSTGAFGSVGVWRSAWSAAFEKLNEVVMTAHGIE